jgi:hypothetical protein
VAKASLSARFAGGQGGASSFWEQLRCPELGRCKEEVEQGGMGPWMFDWERRGERTSEPPFMTWVVVEASSLDNPHIIAYLARRLRVEIPLINIMHRHVLGAINGGREECGWMSTIMGQWGEEAVHSWPRCERMTDWVTALQQKRVEIRSKECKEAEGVKEASREETMWNEFIVNMHVSLCNLNSRTQLQ